MGASLPLEGALRQSLVEHWHLASERRLEAARATRRLMEEASVSVQVEYLGRLHHLAGTTTDQEESRRAYCVVRDLSKVALQQVQPRQTPLQTVELCFLLHDVQCVLNRPDDALYHAKLARRILYGLESSLGRREQAEIDRLFFQAIRAEAVAYHNLKLFSQAYEVCQEGEASRFLRERPLASKPFLFRDKMTVLVGRSRFTLSDVEILAEQARAACEERDDPIDPLWMFLLQESLGRAYLAYGSHKKAERVLQQQLGQLDHIPYIGLLHKTIFFRTYARLQWKQQDQEGWEYFIKLALRTALGAGLTHQVRGMLEEYDPASQALIEKVAGKVPETVLEASEIQPIWGQNQPLG
ncbi:MAG TPA: hypothetical protein VH540_06055 [Ktedonobacterales bacterium]